MPKKMPRNHKQWKTTLKNALKIFKYKSIPEVDIYSKNIVIEILSWIITKQKLIQKINNLEKSLEWKNS